MDVINLSETWADLKYWKKAEKWLPKEFRWEIQGAYKDKKKERCAGNMLTGIRKSLKVKSVGIEKRNVMTVDLEVEDEEWRVISVYKGLFEEYRRSDRKGRLEKDIIRRGFQRENGRTRKFSMVRKRGGRGKKVFKI